MRYLLIFCAFLNLSFAVPNLDDALKAYEGGNYTQAYTDFFELCKAGNAKACFSLGVMSENGEGISEDLENAKGFYNLACKAKLSSACFNLALMLKDEEAEDNEVNLFLYQACDLAHAKACQTLAEIYELKQDGQMSSEFYQRACKLENASSCFKLGDLYKKGSIVKQNTKIAITQYERACKLENALACYTLGRYYDEEKKDKHLAKTYLGKGCDNGNLDSCEAYKSFSLK